ncbi:hypothetical protein Ct61P_14900 [Colletotrichum tofieldiae]|nr:hypothetical protein Ct61P_14900 [Colletotrichum tofieldiae]
MLEVADDIGEAAVVGAVGIEDAKADLGEIGQHLCKEGLRGGEVEVERCRAQSSADVLDVGHKIAIDVPDAFVNLVALQRPATCDRSKRQDVGTQDTHQCYSSGPPSESLANVDHQKNFYTRKLTMKLHRTRIDNRH